MADDKTVEIKFSANTQGAQSGIEQVQKSLEGFTSGITGAAAKFDILFVAFDKLKDLAEIPIKLEEQFAQMGTQIERISRMTGLSTDAVQQFQYAIRLAGGDADSAASTLLILERNIGQALSQAGPARTAFENLGISLQELKTKSPLEIIYEMKTRMDEAGNSAQESALKVDYMRTVAGRAGAQFLAVSGNLDELKKALDDTGGKMSPEMVGHAAELHNSLLNLDLAWQGLKNTLADDIEPLFKGLVDLTKELAAASNSLLQSPIFNAALGAGARSLIPGLGTLQSLSALTSKSSSGVTDYSSPIGPNRLNKPLPTLETGGTGGTGTDDATTIAKGQIDTELSLHKIALEQKKEMLDEEVSANKISVGQKFAALQQFNSQEYEDNYQALEQELALYDEGSVQYAAVLNKETILTAQYFANQEKLSAQGAQATADAQKKAWDSVFNTIDKDLDTMLQGVLQGTQTWQQAMAKLFDNLALSFIEDIAKMTVRWIAFEALGVGSNPFAKYSDDISKLITLITGMGAATTATTVATTASAAATTAAGAASAASAGVQAAASTQMVEGHAASAAAAVYDDVAQIPYVGWLLAPPAAAAAFAAVSAFGSLASAEGGYDIPSGVNPLTQLHQNEMVLPAPLANTVRSISNSSNNGSASSSSGASSTNITFTIQAIDTQSGVQFLKNNAATIASTISGQIRNGNSSLSSMSG